MKKNPPLGFHFLVFSVSRIHTQFYYMSVRKTDAGKRRIVEAYM